MIDYRDSDHVTMVKARGSGGTGVTAIITAANAEKAGDAAEDAAKKAE